MSILLSWLKQWRLKLSEAKTVSSTFHLNNREAKRELNVNICGRRLTCHRTHTYHGVKLDRKLTYREHLTALRGKVKARAALIRRLAGTIWGASTPTLRTSTLALVYAPAEYGALVAYLFFLTMLRQHSQYDSRLGFIFRVLVRVRVSVRLGLGLGLGLELVLGLWLGLGLGLGFLVRVWVRVRVRVRVDFRVRFMVGVGDRIRVNLTLT